MDMMTNGNGADPLKAHKSNKRTQIMTTKELAKYLGVHEMTVYRWLKKGVIPGFKIGGRWRSKKDMLDAFLLDQQNGLKSV